ncbi:hypothetical protein PRUPE_3G064900 [Prunus persica]|uniref:Leucine-rich repeat-containing N-terminal plant-type domain-containing protein n=1 Tax=Prunus persica TaxID=3760 RepID=A0A251PZF2_PRUPE|nr:hypothetical protein PRUPE_3G064900 [Prunus persica]
MFKQDIKDPSNKLLSRVGEGDCCNWTGVVCDNLTGHVRELHLGNYYSDEYLNYSLHQENYLGGKVNTSLLNLKHLSYLDLSNNDFGGIQIPSFLGSLKRLLSKSYYWMKVKNLHWLSGLSSLQNLDLSRVDLSKASDWFQSVLQNTTWLKVLNLRWNIIWGTIPQWLYTCSNLESLSLYLNLLRGEISSCIGNLTAIVNLDSSANQLEGKIPNSLRNLCKLTVLDLSRNYFNGSVSEILGSLSRCSSGQMESLKLSTNDFSGPLFDQLGNFRHLRLLALSSNSISGPIPLSLGHLPFVEEASISEIHINGTLPKTTGMAGRLYSKYPEGYGPLAILFIFKKPPRPFRHVCKIV